MNRTQLINKLIESKGFKSYLEIGTENKRQNFDLINIESKECVDINPNAEATYTMSSDEFFETIPAGKKYDIIFIDAMHVEEYVDKDLTNSLKHLNSGGIICLHDVIPMSKSCAQKKEKYENVGVWNGDVYRTITKLHNTSLNYVTVFNHDHGLCVLFDNDNTQIDITKLECEYTYEDLYDDSGQDINHITKLGKKLLHLITVEEFIKKFSKSE